MLGLGDNNIGSDAVKALTRNTTLTYLHIGLNKLSKKDMDLINQTLEKNRKIQRLRRDDVTRVMFIFKRDSIWRGPDPDSSFWYRLPPDIRNIILQYLINEWFRYSIGKTKQEIADKWKKMVI